MPLHSVPVQARLNGIAACLATSVDTMKVVCDSLNTPFLQPILRTSRSLVELLAGIKQSKNDTLRLLEETNALLLAILELSVKSDVAGDLTPTMLSHIGDFTMTLHKIHAYVEDQQESGKIKKFFRQAETNALLKNCKVGLERALEVFKIYSMDPLKDIYEYQKRTEEMHNETLRLIESVSIRSDTASSIYNVFSGASNSSASMSLLPSRPKIFHGREVELAHVLEAARQPSPRIAILGAGGMGKTSLAKAALHHPDVIDEYRENRFFIPCDSVSTVDDMIALIATYLGIKTGGNMSKQVFHRFSNGPLSLLVLDNLETLWEPTEHRAHVEEFLSHLADIDHLALIITMRGAERPERINWTRPFLPPLLPLAHDAARRVFIDIADDAHDSQDIDKVLLLTENMPLAIDLIAHLAEAEGCQSVLSRWEEEKTSLFSEGHDSRSNLDISISLSLLSPRLASAPQARDLLSLLSTLPDGLSDVELAQSELPIQNILACKVALIRTSLAYTTAEHRLKVLVPIREHMQRYHPPQLRIVDPLFQHYKALLALFYLHNGPLLGEIVPRISSNLANVQNVLLFMIEQGRNRGEVISCGLHLNVFSRLTRQEKSGFMAHIPGALPQPTDHRLEVSFITECFTSHKYQKVENAEALIQQGLSHFPYFDDAGVKCKFYNYVGYYYYMHPNLGAATDFHEHALSIATDTGDNSERSSALYGLAWAHWTLGDYATALRHAIDAQKAAQLSADLFKEANALNVEALVLAHLGKYAPCVRICKRARGLLALWGMSSGQLDSHITIMLAEVHRLKSEYREAREIQTEILRNFPDDRDSHTYASLQMNLAELGIPMGAPASEVQDHIDKAMEVFIGKEFPMDIAICETMQADLFFREGNIAGAKNILHRNIKFIWGKYSAGTNLVLEKLADIDRVELEEARWICPTVFLVHSLKSGEKQFIYKALQFLGEIAAADGLLDTAGSLFAVALEAFTQMDIHRGRAECMMLLGDIAKERGDVVAAEELWRAAVPLFDRSSQRKKVALIQDRLAAARG